VTICHIKGAFKIFLVILDGDNPSFNGQI